MEFTAYIRQLVKIVFSSSAALGIVIGVALLIVGDTSANLDIEFEIEIIDSLWVVVGLPVLAVLAFLTVSPLSVLIYRLLPSARSADHARHA